MIPEAIGHLRLCFSQLLPLDRRTQWPEVRPAEAVVIVLGGLFEKSL